MPEVPEQRSFQGTRLVFGTTGGSTSCDASFLISNLLVCAARGDGSISPAETERMLEILTNRLGNTNASAMAQLSAAAVDLVDRDDLVLQLRRIAGGFSPDEQLTILELVVETVVEDDRIHPGERDAVIFAGQILGIPENRICDFLRELGNRYSR